MSLRRESAPGRVVGLGRATDLAGYALAGAEVAQADTDDDVRRAWEGLGDDVGLVLLTPGARAALPHAPAAGRMLWTVLPAPVPAGPGSRGDAR